MPGGTVGAIIFCAILALAGIVGAIILEARLPDVQQQRVHPRYSQHRARHHHGRGHASDC